jgi:hypothetical protein
MTFERPISPASCTAYLTVKAYYIYEELLSIQNLEAADIIVPEWK